MTRAAAPANSLPVGAVRSGLGFLSWVGAILIVIALVLKAFVFDVAEVGHNGMAPTLIRGERVLIRKGAEPVLGSIAVCRHPTEDGWVVGRVGQLVRRALREVEGHGDGALRGPVRHPGFFIVF